MKKQISEAEWARRVRQQMWNLKRSKRQRRIIDEELKDVHTFEEAKLYISGAAVKAIESMLR